MVETFLLIGMMLAITTVAVVFLAARDAHQHRIREESRPIEERIDAIHRYATFMMEQLQGVLQRHGTERAQEVAWIPEAMDLYRRLESLASKASSSADECLVLSEDASKFEQERRLKGLFVSTEARKLALLLSKKSNRVG